MFQRMNHGYQVKPADDLVNRHRIELHEVRYTPQARVSAVRQLASVKLPVRKHLRKPDQGSTISATDVDKPAAIRQGSGLFQKFDESLRAWHRACFSEDQLLRAVGKLINLVVSVDPL